VICLRYVRLLSVFFQAEDVIRYRNVTGVQTCAFRSYASLPTDPPPTDPRVYDFFKACGYNYLEFCEAGFRSRPDLLPEYYKAMRSEERRVGKECITLFSWLHSAK